MTTRPATKLDLHSGKLYWLLKNGLRTVVPPLERDVRTDVAIVGAGITGALVADALIREGVGVVVLDRRDLGQGSTAASTALLQYDLDIPLSRLERIVGRESARRAYRVGVEAIDNLEQLARELRVDFERVPSLYYTRSRARVSALRRELEARRAAGFDVEWCAARELWDGWGLRAAGAIRSTCSASTDPYALCHALLARARSRGALVHDRTSVASVEETRSGVVLGTSRGGRIRARFLVDAAGYEAAGVLPRGCVQLSSSYAIATEPTKPPEGRWRDRANVWEFANPYHYVRWTGDRLLIGGGDESFVDDGRRDALIGAKARALARAVRTLVPELEMEPAFAWGGTFATTKDAIGYVGPRTPGSRVLFALGFGGNGITYASAASGIVRDMVLGREHRDAELFRFDRPSAC